MLHIRIRIFSIRMAETPITAALRTLLVNGYAVATVERISERAGLLTVQKRDRFGGLATSTILFAEEPAQNVVEMLRKSAEQNGSSTRRRHSIWR
jgi:hypothetical protein